LRPKIPERLARQRQATLALSLRKCGTRFHARNVATIPAALNVARYPPSLICFFPLENFPVIFRFSFPKYGRFH
jgi:hypothetical protein